jgi:hypothetical protein
VKCGTIERPCRGIGDGGLDIAGGGGGVIDVDLNRILPKRRKINLKAIVESRL